MKTIQNLMSEIVRIKEGIMWRLRSHYYTCRFKSMGKRCVIYSHVILNSPENISLGDHVFIHNNVFLSANKKAFICIGNNVSISFGVLIITGSPDMPDHNDQHIFKPIIIEDDVFIGAGSIILQGLTIGKGSCIGAGSVVVRNVPPNTLLSGNPARVIKRYK